MERYEQKRQEQDRTGPGDDEPFAPAAPVHRRSRSSIFFLSTNPPANPPSVPAELMTRCQGMSTGTGFAALACPTARAACGLPAARATHA